MAQGSGYISAIGCVQTLKPCIRLRVGLALQAVNIQYIAAAAAEPQARQYIGICHDFGNDPMT